MKSKQLSVLSWGILVAAAGALTACTASERPSLTGTVTDANNVPVANTAVSLVKSKQTVTTDAHGVYTIRYTGRLGDAETLNAGDGNYARQALGVVFAAPKNKVDVVLRPRDTLATITVPQGTAEAQNVTVSRATGKVTLVIPPDSLVTSSGAMATGQANVQITFWSPDEVLASTPVPMKGAVDGNTFAMDLVTYGMADIEISQGNQLLQVAPGKTLNMFIQEPNDIAGTLSAMDANNADWPALWYADMTLGHWVQQGSAADGSLVYDSNAQTFEAKLPHLSAWNIDGLVHPNFCIQGAIKDTCGNVVANQNLTLWVMGKGEIIQNQILTGADGSFCANVVGGEGANTFVAPQYFVSAYKDPNATACNPTEISTYEQLCGNSQGFACGATSGETNVNRFTPGLTKCQTPNVVAQMCHLCTGTTPVGICQGAYDQGKRVTLGPWVMGGCATITPAPLPATQPCGSNPNVNPCSGPKAKHLGDACSPGDVCCPQGGLICADNLCVPAKDPD